MRKTTTIQMVLLLLSWEQHLFRKVRRVFAWQLLPQNCISTLMNSKSFPREIYFPALVRISDTSFMRKKIRNNLVLQILLYVNSSSSCTPVSSTYWTTFMTSQFPAFMLFCLQNPKKWLPYVFFHTTEARSINVLMCYSSASMRRI